MPILLFVFFLGIVDWGQCQESLAKERILSAFTGRVPEEWGEGVMAAIPELKKRGFKLVKVSDFGLR